MQKIWRTARSGFALPAAILAIIVLGAIVTGGFYAASQEGRIGSSSQFGHEAFYAAERGLNEILGTYTRAQLEELAIDSATTVGPVQLTHDGLRTTYTVTIRRMADRLYYLESTGEVRSGGHLAGARRQVGMLVRTQGMDGEFHQALRVYGQLAMNGSARVSGNDTIPDAWTDQCTPGAPHPGVIVQDATHVEKKGASTIVGTPPVATDGEMTLTEFTQWGDLLFEDLSALAIAYGKVYSPSDNESGAEPGPAGSDCEVERRSNWGAPDNPNHPCHLYFPVILAQGEDRTFRISGSSVGQGILLVEGDLQMDGSARFYGIVVVKGTFSGSGSARINGAVLVGSNGSTANNDESTVSGSSVVQYSSCAVRRAQVHNDALSRTLPLVERSWVDLSLVSEGHP